jgi:hypothetical protein
MNIADPFSAWMRSLPGLSRSEPERVSRLDLIGIDMASTRAAERSKTFVPAIALIVLAALLLAILRMDVRRMSYASPQAVTQERDLLDQKRNITVQLRRLREPKLLSERAAKLGFATPERVITLRAERVSQVHAPQVGAEPRP